MAMDEGTEGAKKHYSIIRILCIACTSVASQLGYDMVYVLLDPLMFDLKLSEVHKAAIWTLGPVAGFIVQPVVAYYSDRCRSRFGRRSPFIFFGSVLSSLSNVLLFVVYHFRRHGNRVLKIVAVYFGVGMSFSTTNIFDVVSRSLMCDLMPPDQEQIGCNLLCGAAGIAIIVSNIIGGLGYFVKSPGYQDQVPQWLFIIGSAFILGAVPITLCAAQEKPFKGEVEDIRLLPQLWRALKSMPGPVLHAGFNQMCSNWAFFPAQMKTTSFFKEEVFGGDEQSQNKGLCFGMLFLSVAGAVNMTYGILQVFILKRIGPKIPYVISHGLLTICCLSLFFARNEWLVGALLIPVWIGTVILLSVPYGITGMYIPAPKMGVYVGLMNCFICIGEQAAVGTGYLAMLVTDRLPKRWNIKGNRASIGAGMVSGFAGFILSWFLKVPDDKEQERLLNSNSSQYDSIS
jgi:Na+/melibiose symporter-like transporter